MESSAVDLVTYVRIPLSDAHVAHLRSIGEIVHFAAGETIVVFGSTTERSFISSKVKPPHGTRSAARATATRRSVPRNSPAR
jgi:thioredoxin reductase (NADPH)